MTQAVLADQVEVERVSDSYREIIAWQKGMELVTTVYAVTEPFPSREMYGLTRQLRDSALSVPSNIAEGKGRETKLDYLQFLFRARGSLYEAETQLEASRRLHFLDEETFERVHLQSAEAGRVLNGLIKSVKRQLQEEGNRPPDKNA